MVDIFLDTEGKEIFRVDDAGKMVFTDKKKKEEKKEECVHMYSRAMNQPYPRACTKCGEIEDAK